MRHVAPGQSIQAAINSSSSGDTVYIDSGSHTENVTLKGGVLYIGDTATFNGRPRTIVNGAFSSDGQSGWTMYGLQWQGGTPSISGPLGTSSSISLTNCVFDNTISGGEAGGPNLLNWQGIVGLTIQWCTFQHGAGPCNAGFGTDCQNLLFQRNFLSDLRGDGLAQTVGDNNSNIQYLFNVIMGWRSFGFEIIPGASLPPPNPLGLKFNDNWLHADNLHDACVSQVTGGDFEIARNVLDAANNCTGCAGWCIEFDCVAPYTGTIHDNLFFNAITAVSDNYNNSTVVSGTNNNFSNCANGSAVNVNPLSAPHWTGSTTNTLSIPPQPAAGAST